MTLNKKYRLFFYLLLLLIVKQSDAQNTIFDDDRLNYNRAASGGVMIHNLGWGLDFEKYYHKTVDKKRYFEIQLDFIHHPKQKKVYNPFFRDAKGYFFGKLNSFFVLRFVYGNQRIIAYKIRSSGVELSYKWGIGASIGFLKPVYLDIINFENNIIIIQKYNPEIHNELNIFGRAGGLRGFDEIKIRPGVYAKFGLMIEYSPKKRGFTGLEVGFALDSYFQTIEIMANTSNLQFFPLLYLNIYVGSKYDKK